jgi:hypothetical protein
MRMAYRFLVRKPERSRLSDRPRCEWDIIKMDIRDIGVEWINLAQDRD